MDSEQLMRQAISLARENVRAGRGGPFGAVVVLNGEIIGRGANRVTALNDPTAHAEIVAIREACRAQNSFRLERCEIYSTCEPCPMCLSAIYWADIRKLIYASDRTEAADAGFIDEFLYQEFAKPIEARSISSEQMLRGEAAALFEEWKRNPTKVPY